MHSLVMRVFNLTGLLLGCYLLAMLGITGLITFDVAEGTREFFGVVAILFGTVLGMWRNPNNDLPLFRDTALEGTSLSLIGAGTMLTLAGSVLRAGQTERMICGGVLIVALVLGMIWKLIGARKEKTSATVETAGATEPGQVVTDARSLVGEIIAAVAVAVAILRR